MKRDERLKRIPVTALIGIAIGIMVWLGFWQLDRMHQKEQRLESIAQKAAKGAFHLDELRPAQEDIRDYRVGFNGEAHIDKVLFLDNQVEDGRVGYDVVVPVSTHAGVVLVNFGWVPAPVSRAELPDININDRFQHFHGMVAIPAKNPVVRETLSQRARFPVVIQEINIPFLKKLTDEPLAPFIVQLTAPENTAFVRNWQPVVMPPQKHMGYAVQWFGLAIAASVIAYLTRFNGNKG